MKENKANRRSGVGRVTGVGAGRARERKRRPLAKTAPWCAQTGSAGCRGALWLGVSIRRLGAHTSPDCGVRGPVHSKPVSCSLLFLKAYQRFIIGVHETSRCPPKLLLLKDS